MASVPLETKRTFSIEGKARMTSSARSGSSSIALCAAAFALLLVVVWLGYKALKPVGTAAETLAAEGIQARVIDMHTVKPLDHEAVEKAARETGGIVVAEEHLLHGGLGSYVAVSVAENYPTHMRFIGLDDVYAESGAPDAVLEKYGLTAKHIADCAREIAHMPRLRATR